MPKSRRRTMATVPGLAGKYSLLDADAARSVIAAGQHMVDYVTHGKPGALVLHSANLADLKPEEVRQVLRRLPIGDQEVEIVWPPKRTGVRMRFTDCVANYDEL